MSEDTQWFEVEPQGLPGIDVSTDGSVRHHYLHPWPPECGRLVGPDAACAVAVEDRCEEDSAGPCQSPGCDLDLSACVCGNPFGTVRTAER